MQNNESVYKLFRGIIKSMNKITLTQQATDGQLLEVTFLPDQGMNLISLKKGNTEVIDQSTWALFEERFAGLGALIGPHFHRRNAHVIPLMKDESLFPHIARVKAKGVQDPFSHGIARYAPWKKEFDQTSVRAELKGKDEWNGVSLASLEGQDFKMNLHADLKPNGLFLQLSVVSETASLVGIHYYYALKGKSHVVSKVQEKAFIENELKKIPSEWGFKENHALMFDLEREADYSFYPFPDVTKGEIILKTEDHSLKTTYECSSSENCWQLYHPKGASFVCIEPISSKDPRHPNLTVSSLNIHLEIIQ